MRLLTFLPCEKVLFGHDQTVSLIVVLSEIHFGQPTPDAFKNIPAGTGAFFRWAVFTQWEVEEGDIEGQAYEQCIALALGSGELAFTNVTQFTFPSPTKIQRLVGNFDVIPLLPEGRYELIAKWHKAGDSDWIEGSRYPVVVTYDPPRVPPSPITAPSS
jgi:hypothetical protein